MSTGTAAQFCRDCGCRWQRNGDPDQPRRSQLLVRSRTWRIADARATFTIFGTVSGPTTRTSPPYERLHAFLRWCDVRTGREEGRHRCGDRSYKGFNIKATEFYDGINDNFIIRLDVLFGWAATCPELAVLFAT